MPLIDPITMAGISADSKVRPSMPIELLPNDIARVVTHLQPIIYLSSFYLRFPALVADPVPTLLVSLIPLALCQIVYCIVCLPAAGAAAKLPKKAQKGTIGAVKKPRYMQTPSNIFVSACAAIESFVALLLIINYYSTRSFAFSSPLSLFPS
jgi:GPI ethanolamine phosphate transferase 2/3 subunit F